jgi:hypothetical protein
MITLYLHILLTGALVLFVGGLCLLVAAFTVVFICMKVTELAYWLSELSFWWAIPVTAFVCLSYVVGEVLVMNGFPLLLN